MEHLASLVSSHRFFFFYRFLYVGILELELRGMVRFTVRLIILCTVHSKYRYAVIVNTTRFILYMIYLTRVFFELSTSGKVPTAAEEELIRKERYCYGNC